jgi:hypothetical protein
VDTPAQANTPGYCCVYTAAAQRRTAAHPAVVPVLSESIEGEAGNPTRHPQVGAGWPAGQREGCRVGCMAVLMRCWPPCVLSRRFRHIVDACRAACVRNLPLCMPLLSCRCIPPRMDSPCSSTTSCSSSLRAWPSRSIAIRCPVGATERPLRSLPRPAFAQPHLADCLSSLDAGLGLGDILQASISLRQEQQLSVSCCGPAPLPWSAACSPQPAIKRPFPASSSPQRQLGGCDYPASSSCSTHSDCDLFPAPARNVRRCLPQLVIG